MSWNQPKGAGKNSGFKWEKQQVPEWWLPAEEWFKKYKAKTDVGKAFSGQKENKTENERRA